MTASTLLRDFYLPGKINTGRSVWALQQHTLSTSDWVFEIKTKGCTGSWPFPIKIHSGLKAERRDHSHLLSQWHCSRECEFGGGGVFSSVCGVFHYHLFVFLFFSIQRNKQVKQFAAFNSWYSSWKKAKTSIKYSILCVYKTQKLRHCLHFIKYI